jgi:signal transduction histidine kinase/ActR/RegA family two-component response regulator
MRRWTWAPIALLALGLISVVLLAVLDGLRERLTAEDFVLMRATGDVQAGLAVSHLWMEQYAAGDAIAPAEIWEGIDRSRSLVRALLDGGEIQAGDRWRIERLAEPDLRRQALALQGEIRHFEEITRERQAGVESGLPVGVGSAADRVYDRVFRNLMIHADQLRSASERRLARRLARFRFYSRCLLGGWVLLLGFAFAGFRRFEERRRRAESVLRDRETQLVEAQKMEAVGRLAGGMAHDINNYLAAIRTQCEVLLRKPQPAERVAEKLSLVVAAVEKASALIARLLAFGRRQPIRPEVVNLNRVVEGLEKLMKQHLGENVELDLALAADLGNVNIDPTQVEQVLVNLLVNAREAMPQGGRLAVETANVSFGDSDSDRNRRPVAHPGDYVLLAVSDTGIGIPLDIRDKIFEPFFTTKQEAGNSGLGLATLYGIVKQNAGNVWVYSEPGRGTTFKIYLPRCREEAAAPVRSARSAQPAGVPRSGGGSERILLVEDNAEVRESTQNLLAAAGYRVVLAADGSEALALLARLDGLDGTDRAVDLVITDVVMPGLSGPELAGRLRERYGPIPVIFVSGYSDSVVHFHGVLDPQVHFLSKPFAAEALFQKVREALAAPRDSVQRRI